MFEAKDRGLAMGVFGAMPWLGPSVGPIVSVSGIRSCEANVQVGGFLSPHSWRWAAAVVAVFSLILMVLHLLVLPETYAPVLLRRRAHALSLATDKAFRSEQDAAKPFCSRELIKHQLRVPYILMFTEPIVFILSL